MPSLDLAELLRSLPPADNAPGALDAMLEANRRLRQSPWPPPFHRTKHSIRLGDARKLDWLESGSVDLVVTSPPYWTLKEYEHSPGQMGDVEDYEAFLDQLDSVWSHCARALVPGGRICCVVGDVCLPRKKAGRHLVMPLHQHDP